MDLHSSRPNEDAFARQIANAVAATLRFMRAQHDLSQEMLARQAQIDRSSYARLERGERPISLLQLVKIAKALGCSAASLVKAIECELQQGAWADSQGWQAGKPIMENRLKLAWSKD